MTAIDGAVGDGAGAAAARESQAAQSLARIVFALLVVACFAAFFITQRLKHTPTALQHVTLTASFAPHSGEAEHISFKSTHDDQVTVQIFDATGDLIATLVRDYPVTHYKQLYLRWNGRRGTAAGYRLQTTENGSTLVFARTHGAFAPAGEYHVLVVLRRQHRTLRLPRDFTLVAR